MNYNNIYFSYTNYNIEKINAQNDGHHHGKLSLSNSTTTTTTIHDNNNNNNNKQHDANNKYILVNVTPYPGFVVKTRRLLDNVNKVFINIFHHDLIDLESPGVGGGVSDKDLQKPYLFMNEPTEVCIFI
jgi:hypothetical protein